MAGPTKSRPSHTLVRGYRARFVFTRSTLVRDERMSTTPIKDFRQSRSSLATTRAPCALAPLPRAGRFSSLAIVRRRTSTWPETPWSLLLVGPFAHGCSLSRSRMTS